jgi:hypothetical protein
MTSKPNPSSDRLERLQISDLQAFNGQVAKLIAAGVPIRFPGAPVSVVDWLQGISHRAAVNVGLGQSPSGALKSDPSVRPAYLQALSAWLANGSDASELAGVSDTSEPSGSQRDLSALDPWVQTGLRGERLVGRSEVYAFWLWLVAFVASLALIHSVWVMQPKLRQFYENSGLVIGPGYRWMDWLYSRLGFVTLALALFLIAFPLVWRFWIRGVAKHWSLPSYFARIFFVAYLVLGGAITALIGCTVFLPMIELLTKLGAPGP